MNKQPSDTRNESIRDTAQQAEATPRVDSRLHPLVYVLVAGLSAWLVLSVWSFAGAGVTDYLLVIVSGFVLMAVGLPFVLSRVARSDDGTVGHVADMSLRDWLRKDFDTWAGRLSGGSAMAQILLPIAAVAFGMTTFGIVMLVVEHASS